VSSQPYLDIEAPDCAFQVWSLLQEIADVRNLVKEAWKEYYNGDISTSVAMDVAQTALSDVFGMGGHLGDDTYPVATFDQLCETLGVSFSITSGKLVSSITNGNQRAPSALELLCVSAYNTLCHVRWSWYPGLPEACAPFYRINHGSIARDMVLAGEHLRPYCEPGNWKVTRKILVGDPHPDLLSSTLIGWSKLEGLPVEIPWSMVAVTRI